MRGPRRPPGPGYGAGSLTAARDCATYNRPVRFLNITIDNSPRIRGARWVVALAALVLLVLFRPAEAEAAVPVKRYDLRCDTHFPCHDDLRRRTDFWIEVYGKWTTRQGVFHDATRPERVYSVIDVPNGCRGEDRTVERERERIRKQLFDLAEKVQGKRRLSDDEQALAALFPDRSAKAMRVAAREIRCQQGNRDRFEGALKRYGAYGPLVRRMIREAGLPDDVHYLPFVESLYNPRAYSRVGAAGLWQIMPKTARYLGLELNATLDERLDLEAATLAAIRYLEDSRSRLTALAKEKKPSVKPGELGPFVITSYNYGVNGMRRALDEFGPDFMKVLNEYKSPSFQVAVKNFYASFLAARHVASHASQFFGEVPGDPAVHFHTVVLDHDTSMKRIIDVFGVGEDELKALNGALTRFVWHGWRFVPKGYRLKLPARNGGWSGEERRLAALGPESDQRGPVNYTVRRGDTACGIARAFHVKCADLVDMNRLGRRAFIRIGQTLTIPGKLGTVAASTSASSSTPAASGGKGGSYRVRRGDSPCGIASRAGVSCAALLAANNLGRSSVIHPGQVLTLPGGAAGGKPPARYTVRGGDTPCEVAERFSVSCDAMLAMNGMNRSSVLRVGQVLRFPGGSGAPAEEGGADTPTPSRYTVQRGDTACEVAERYSVSCDDMLALNHLGRGSVLSIGQVLSMPGGSRDADLGEVVGAATLRDVAYTVQPGDTPCQVAERFDMNCDGFLRLNNLKRHGVIYVGQTLKVRQEVGDEAEPSLAVAGPPADEAVVDTAGDAASSPLDGDMKLDIDVRGSGDAARYTIVVEPDETLGHYADWLGIGGVGAIKQLNGIGATELISIGARLRLPVDGDAQRAAFNQKRSDYHRVLVEEFKEAYRVETVENYRVRVGDSAWKVADRFQLPLWVLTRYNPELRNRNPLTGEMLKVPKVTARG